MDGTFDGTIEETTSLGYLTAHDLTVDELRRNRLPDRSLNGLSAEIKTEDGHRFGVTYIRYDERSYVDITPVVEPGPSRHGYAPVRFTLGQIADILDLLTATFTVKINSVSFGEVPRSAAEQSGLPLEKLTFEIPKSNKYL